MKRLILLSFACCASPQTATVTFPISGATISSYWPTTLTRNVQLLHGRLFGGMGYRWRVDSRWYLLDIAPYSFAWPSYNVANGVHAVPGNLPQRPQHRHRHEPRR